MASRSTNIAARFLRLDPHIATRRVLERFQLAFARLAGGDLGGRLGRDPSGPVGPPGAKGLFRRRDPGCELNIPFGFDHSAPETVAPAVRTPFADTLDLFGEKSQLKLP